VVIGFTLKDPPFQIGAVIHDNKVEVLNCRIQNECLGTTGSGLKNRDSHCSVRHKKYHQLIYFISKEASHFNVDNST